MKRVVGTLFRAAVPVAMLFLMQNAVALIAVIVTGSFHLSLSLLTMIADIALLVLVAAWFLLRKRSPLCACGFSPCGFKPLLLAVGAGAGACVLVQWMMLTIPFPADWMADYQIQSDAIVAGPAVWQILATVVAAPLTEEVVYRGLMYRTLKEAMPPWLAALLSSAVFGMMHGSLLWTIYTIPVGLLLIYVYERSGSLTGSVLCHMAFNIVGQLPLLSSTYPLAVIAAVVLIGFAVFAVSISAFRKPTSQ